MDVNKLLLKLKKTFSLSCRVFPYLFYCIIKYLCFFILILNEDKIYTEKRERRACTTINEKSYGKL